MEQFVLIDNQICDVVCYIYDIPPPKTSSQICEAWKTSQTK